MSDATPQPPRSLRRPDPGDEVVVALLQRCTFPDLPELVCAVSGGADSLALLALAVATGRPVTAVHVDHGLRPRTATEADLVEEVAVTWGARSRSVAVLVEPGADLEQRARSARHAALPASALFGHTLDDQAETLLIRMIRGTGPSGLARMDPDRHPIIGLRRSETVALCDHLGVVPFTDPSNSDPRFVRNRIRSEVLPLLSDVAQRDVAPLVARLAELAAEQRELIEHLASTVDVTDAAAVSRAPRPVAVAALGTWWMVRSGAPHPPDAAALDRMMDVAAGLHVGCDVRLGWSLRRSAGRLRLEPPPGSDASDGWTALSEE